MQSKNLNLLIVENEFMAFEYLKNILNAIQIFEIFHASSSDEALQIVRENSIDICFMDINIFGSIDGITCARILNQEYFLPIVYTTAHADSQTISEAKDTNVYGYLVKPFNIKEVEATLNVAIKVASMVNKPETKSTPKLNTTLITLSQNYSYDKKKKTFFIENTPFKLTHKELSLIDYLCNHINQNVSYDAIKETLWNTNETSTATLRDTIYRIKNKLPELSLENISNYGYILKSF